MNGGCRLPREQGVCSIYRKLPRFCSAHGDKMHGDELGDYTWLNLLRFESVHAFDCILHTVKELSTQQM